MSLRNQPTFGEVEVSKEERTRLFWRNWLVQDAIGRESILSKRLDLCPSKTKEVCLLLVEFGSFLARKEE